MTSPARSWPGSWEPQRGLQHGELKQYQGMRLAWNIIIIYSKMVLSKKILEGHFAYNIVCVSIDKYWWPKKGAQVAIKTTFWLKTGSKSSFQKRQLHKDNLGCLFCNLSCVFLKKTTWKRQPRLSFFVSFIKSSFLGKRQLQKDNQVAFLILIFLLYISW